MEKRFANYQTAYNFEDNDLDNIRQSGYCFAMKNHVQLFKTLADETRLRILMLLYAEGELCVCDITAALLLPQSTISRHLATLKKTATVLDRREGLWIYYSINHHNLLMEEMESFLRKSLQESLAAANDRKRLQSYNKEDHCA